MKPFKFRLDSVLSLREREAQAATLEYSRALQTMALAHHALKDAWDLRDGLSETFAERRRHGFRAGEQDVFWKSMQERHYECAQRAEIFEKAAKNAELCRLAMFAAKSKHEMLLHLKSKQRIAHEAAGRHAEELQIDDVVSARYAMNLRRAGA